MQIFDILYVPMGFILRQAYSLTNNYLFAIFLFTLVMEILLLPLAIKQQKNQIKQASLAPKVAALRKKYAGRNDQATQQKMQNELMDLYQKENFNPAGGCGTLLIQLPILLCLYQVVINPLRYICNIPAAEIDSLKNFIVSSGVELGNYNPQIQMINIIRENVANYYSVAPSLEGAVLPVFKVGPFDLSQTPELSFSPFNWLMLIPLITFVVMILSQKIMQKFTYQDPTAADTQNSTMMKVMTWGMPLMSVYIEFQMAAAIGVYWTFRSVIQTIQRIIIAKVMPLPKFTEEDYKEAERNMNMSGKQRKREQKERDPNRKPVRSLHHIDDEEWLAKHGMLETDEEEKKEDVKVPVSEITESKKVEAKGTPAPIKNDEKTSYKEKANERDAKNDEKWEN